MSTGVEVGILAKALQGLIGAVVALLGSGTWFWSWKRRKDKLDDTRDDKINSLEKKLQEHGNLHLTEPKVKLIVKDSITPLEKEIEELKQIGNHTQKIVQELVTEIRVMNAIAKERKEQDNRKE